MTLSLLCSMVTSMRSYRIWTAYKVRIPCPRFSTYPLMRHPILLALASSLLPVLALAASPAARGSDSTFDPWAFPLRQAVCPGINRAENNKTVDLYLRMLLTIAFYYPLIRFLFGRIC